MRIRKTFLLLLATFFVGISLGVAYAYLQPERAGEYVSRLVQEIGRISSNPFRNFVEIFKHNAEVALLTLISGLFFGIGPWFLVLFNGITVGVVGGFLASRGVSVWKIILGLVPHGVVEIPAFVLAGTAGILWYRSIRNAEEPARGFKEGMIAALKLYAVTVGMLLIAAFIEAYITPRLMRLG